MKRFSKTLIASLAVSSLIVTPAMAAPASGSVQAQKSAIQSEVSSLQTQLTSVMTKMNELEADMIVKGQEIDRANTELAAAKEKEQKQYEAMKLRIKYMYEEGNASSAIMEEVLESGDTAEVVNQVEYFQNVHKYDRKQMEAYVETKTKIETIKASLETEMQNISQMQTDFVKQQETIGATINAKQVQAADLNTHVVAAAEAAAVNQAKNEAKVNKSKTVVADKDKAETTEKENTVKPDKEEITKPDVDNTQKPDAEAPTQPDAEAPTQPDAEAPTQPDAEAPTQPDAETPTQPDVEAPSEPDAEEPDAEEPDAEAPSQPEIEAPAEPEVEEPSQPEEDSSAADIIVSTAWSYIGVPYVYGGGDRDGIDCSGLTKACYAAAGISIPRTSGSQASTGRNVGGLANALPGDIVCYPGHVAVYIGGGRVIHAPQPGESVKEAGVSMGAGQPITKIVRFW